MPQAKVNSITIEVQDRKLRRSRASLSKKLGLARWPRALGVVLGLLALVLTGFFEISMPAQDLSGSQVDFFSSDISGGARDTTDHGEQPECAVHAACSVVVALTAGSADSLAPGSFRVSPDSKVAIGRAVGPLARPPIALPKT